MPSLAPTSRKNLLSPTSIAHATRWLLFSVTAMSLLTACQPSEDGKKTRLRPDIRRKVTPTIDTATGSTKTQAKLKKTETAIEITSNRCDLIRDESDLIKNEQISELEQNKSATEEAGACDAILVQTDKVGKIQFDVFKNIENVESGHEFTTKDVQRYALSPEGKPVADESGPFFAVDYKSTKGQKIQDGRDTLYLSYILPIKAEEVDLQSLIVKINDTDLRLSKDDQTADLLVSEWTGQLVLRIKNIQLIENINFDLQIRGQLKSSATTTDVEVISEESP